MQIRYSEHAKRRIEERAISRDEVETTVKRPLQTKATKYGREISCRHFTQCYFLVVVSERSEEGFIIVTALKVDRERVARFGFAGV